MNTYGKKNNTSLRVLEILKILIQQPSTSDELIRKIATTENIENIYASETLLKYFHTLELVGLFVEKNKTDGRYFLRNLPLETEFNEEELKLLCLLEGYVNRLYQLRIEEPFNDLLSNLKRSFSKTTADLYKKVKSEKSISSDVDSIYNSSLIKRLEKYCVDSQKLKIGYLSKSNKCTEVYTVEPKGIEYDIDRAYLLAYNPELAQNQKMLLENIIYIAQLPQKAAANISPNTVVFELKGRLAKNYKLKEGEKVINHTKDTIVVSNSVEDKYILFRRLLKYGESCKILQSRAMQKEFLGYVDKIISKLEKEESI